MGGDREKGSGAAWLSRGWDRLWEKSASSSWPLQAGGENPPLDVA